MIESPQFSFVKFTSLGDDKDPACDDIMETLDVIALSDLAFQLHLTLDSSSAITYAKLKLKIQSHSGVAIHQKEYSKCLLFNKDDKKVYIFFIKLEDVDISEIIAEGECFRFLAEIETDLSTYSARSNLFRFAPACEHTTLLEYKCDEVYSLGFYYCGGLYNKIRIPCQVSKPQTKEESNIYIKRNGQRKVLSASLSKEYELETDWMSEEFHDKLAIALMHDAVLLDGKLLTKSSSYEIGWDDTNPLSAPAKCKLIENILYKNFNCGVSSGCVNFEGEEPEDPEDPEFEFIENFDHWSGGTPVSWIREDSNCTISQIAGGGILFKDTVGTKTAIIGRVISAPSGTYRVTITLHQPIPNYAFNYLSFAIDSFTQPSAKLVRFPFNSLTLEFDYTGTIGKIELRYLSAWNDPYEARVKSIQIITI